MDKNQIREIVLEKRNKLDKKIIIEKGNIVKEKLFALPEYKKAKTIMFFLSFSKEVYTHDMVKEALEDKDKEVVVPKIKEFEIIPCSIKKFSELLPGAYRILEPVEVKEIEPRKIDIILVPGIAFDKRGYRIGYGKGYYDRFLKRSKALRIGLCMDFQIVDNIPHKEWDIPMGIVITEKRVIKV